jgi:hypothetical protein
MCSKLTTLTPTVRRPYMDFSRSKAECTGAVLYIYSVLYFERERPRQLSRDAAANLPLVQQLACIVQYSTTVLSGADARRLCQ